MSEKTATIDLRRLQLAGLKPHPRNPRTHPDPGTPQWEILKKSLGLSYFDPLVWNERNGMLVSGHLRSKLLQEMEYTYADVSVVNFDEATHLAVMTIANKHGGDFDPELLRSLAVDIDTAGLDVALAGFEEKAFMAMLECPPVSDDTASAEELLSKADLLQQKWQVQPGDLFQICSHRLLCGACEALDNWRRLLGNNLLDMFWTDPPYNVNYDSIQERRNDLNITRGRTPHVVPAAPAPHSSRASRSDAPASPPNWIQNTAPSSWSAPPASDCPSKKKPSHSPWQNSPMASVTSCCRPTCATL